jgi:DNA modification methylase
MQMAVYGYKSGAYFGDDNPKRSNVFVADAYRFGQPDKTGHPTQTPLILMERFVRAMALPGMTVLDPFLGSGTTLVACAKHGRRGIGIEINPEWFDMACRRVEEAVAQPSMFVDQPVQPPPKQTSIDW